nr:glycosyltransferase family 2 protein [Microbacterium halimionae]
MPWGASDTDAQALLRLDQLTAQDKPADGVTREEAQILGLSLPHLGPLRRTAGVVLSIVVPTHNVRDWVEATLKSILAQNVPKMQVIVVDDHSTDGTLELLRNIAEGDQRVQVISAVTSGGGSARNIGVDHARGKYLIFCDGDDIVPDGAYAALISSLEESGSEIAIGDYLKFSPNDTWRPTAAMEAFDRPQLKTSIADEPTLVYSRPCWNKAFRRDFWESQHIRFPDVSRSNDIVPMTRAYLLARRIDIIEDVVYLYRDRPGTSSMTARARSAASTVSYFEQEAECARLVISAHNFALNAIYSSLIFDRDGFVHIAKYLQCWAGPSSSDELVSGAVEELLRLTERPPLRIHPLKRMTLVFVSLGDFRAAAAAVQLLDEDSISETESVAKLWCDFIKGLTNLNDPIDSEDLRFFSERVADALKQGAMEFESRVSRDALLAASEGLFGESFVRAATLFDFIDSDTVAFIKLRAEVGGSVSDVSGGASLILRGSSRVGSDRVSPILYDPASTTHPWIAPRSVEWTEEGEEFSWTAQWDAGSLPMHRSVVPALADTTEDIAVPVPVRAEPPEYVGFDTFLYRSVRESLFIDRRRHWAIRAVRRGAIITRDRAVHMPARAKSGLQKLLLSSD